MYTFGIHRISLGTIGEYRRLPMKFAIERITLEKLLGHATSSARIVGHSDAFAAGPLGDHIDAIVNELSELLGNSHPVPSVRTSYDDESTEVRPCPALPPRIDVEGEVNNLRCRLARASALVLATESWIERAPWGDDADEDRRRLEDLSHLLGAAGEALKVAVDNGAQLVARLAKLTAARLDAALAKYSTGGA
jgi:hypothetical protein